MKIVTTLQALRAFNAQRQAKKASLGFVPTMGALHEGHAALMRRARAENDQVLVSIFINPTQFGPNEDLSRYPRTPEPDEALLQREGVDVLYRPEVADMYPEGFATKVHVSGIGDYLCGPFRPGHFDGVATVVARLLGVAGATRAYFGQKDWQQLQLVTRLAADLAIQTEITGVPTVREADGLALSSRNRYLDENARKAAAVIPRTLHDTAQKMKAAGADISALLEEGRVVLKQAGFTLDYLELAGAADCMPRTDLAVPARLFVAARIGGTRLIDNWPV